MIFTKFHANRLIIDGEINEKHELRAASPRLRPLWCCESPARSVLLAAQQIWDIHTSLIQLWPTVCDAGPPFNQSWVNVFVLGGNMCGLHVLALGPPWLTTLSYICTLFMSPAALCYCRPTAAMGHSAWGRRVLTHSLTHLLTHSFTHPLTHSLTHSLTQCTLCLIVRNNRLCVLYRVCNHCHS